MKKLLNIIIQFFLNFCNLAILLSFLTFGLIIILSLWSLTIGKVLVAIIVIAALIDTYLEMHTEGGK